VWKWRDILCSASRHVTAYMRTTETNGKHINVYLKRCHSEKEKALLELAPSLDHEEGFT